MEFRDLKKQYSVLKDEIDKSIAGVLSSAQFISGGAVRELEAQLAEYVGVKYGLQVLENYLVLVGDVYYKFWLESVPVL